MSKKLWLNRKNNRLLLVGGYSINGTILKSTEYRSLNRNWTVTYHKAEDYKARYTGGRGTQLADMSQARSGHGCSLLTSDRSKIIVSGGSRTDNGEAVDTTEIYDVANDQWMTVQSMNQPRFGKRSSMNIVFVSLFKRFGHAIVKIGDSVVAVGGSKLHPDVILDTIEKFDEDSGWEEISVKMKHPRANFGYTLVPHSFFGGCKLV